MIYYLGLGKCWAIAERNVLNTREEKRREEKRREEKRREEKRREEKRDIL
jgi:hypothetical protein